MDHFEIEEALDSFRVIADNREQDTPKAKERYEAFGVPYERATLSYGDYCGLITLNGSAIYDTSKRISAKCVIERKMSLDELAMCFTRQRDRFRREMERATQNGAIVYLLVESGSYEAILNHRYRSKFNPTAFISSLMAWIVRYNLRPIFCKPDTSGKIIKEILYRDMKERLENGEFG